MGKKRIITKSDGTGDQGSDAAAGVDARKSTKKQVINGIVYVTISYNNTIVTITDLQGNAIAWASSGRLGFKGTRKSTPYAANLVAKDCIERARKYNLSNVRIIIKGIGPARESAIRGIAGSGLNVISIMDETPVAHNGVKARKPRRI